MDNEALLIAQIKDLLADAQPELARRVIDYFATTYRAELAQREAPRPAPAQRSGEPARKPSFMNTEHRIEMGEIMLALERKGAGGKNRR